MAASLIQSVARQAQLTFSKSFQEESFPECFAKLKSLVKQVRESDVTDRPELIQTSRHGRFGFAPKAPVEYMGIFENDVFTMGVFVVNRGSKIPLHDHPRMCGILKVIHGKLKIKCYTPLEGDSLPQSIKKGGKLSAHDLSLLHAAKPHSEQILSTDDDPCILEPVESNWHEISSVDGPAAFLDILAPPYGIDDRDCHYYKKVGDASSSRSSDTVQWMLEVPAPRDFWCSSISYTGPKVVIG